MSSSDTEYNELGVKLGISLGFVLGVPLFLVTLCRCLHGLHDGQTSDVEKIRNTQPPVPFTAAAPSSDEKRVETWESESTMNVAFPSKAIVVDQGVTDSRCDVPFSWY